MALLLMSACGGGNTTSEGGNTPAPSQPSLPLTADADGDGIADNTDNCPSAPNPAQNDADEDGTGDLCDPNTDFAITIRGADGSDIGCGGQVTDGTAQDFDGNPNDISVRVAWDIPGNAISGASSIDVTSTQLTAALIPVAENFPLNATVGCCDKTFEVKAKATFPDSFSLDSNVCEVTFKPKE